MARSRILLLLAFSFPLLALAQVTDNEPRGRPDALVPTKITLQTSPSGLTVIVDGISQVTPYNTNWTSGTSHTINTSSPQSGGSGTRYLFSTWSDGGGQSHTVVAPATTTTYTATFSTQYYLTMSATPSAGGT